MTIITYNNWNVKTYRNNLKNHFEGIKDFFFLFGLTLNKSLMMKT